MAVGEIKVQAALDVLNKEGVLQEVHLMTGEPQATVGNINEFDVAENVMIALGIPADAKVYEITQDVFDALPEAEQQALIGAGIDLRLWQSQEDDEGMSITTHVAFYVLGWQKGGKMHFTALDTILTPSEKSEHAAYAFRQLEKMSTTAGGQTISYDVDKRPFEQRLAAAQADAKINTIDDVKYEVLPLFNIYKNEIPKMINEPNEYRSMQMDDGHLHWTRPVPSE